MTTSLTTSLQQVSTRLIGSLRALGAGLFALLLLTAVQPAQAQMEDGELPKIDFSVNLMQSGQFLSIDNNTGNWHGFHQVRAGLVSSVQFSERVSGLLMLEAEPNDFGQNGFAPAVDFVTLDLALTDELTLRTGTPVTGLINFRGFSDGPVVQGNPLIGNSPADMITAAHGVKLIGAYEAFGFDVTVNRSFLEDFSNGSGVATTGVNLIGKVRFTGSDMFKVGLGAATHTGNGVIPNGDQNGVPGVVFANGDRENYNLANRNGASASTNTHVNMPASTIAQADAKIMSAGADIDAWLGYAVENDTPIYGDNDFSALFAGLGAKYSVAENFHLAGRFTYIGDQSEGASDVDHTAVSRTQLGFGYQVFDKALFKVEYVRQVEGGNTSLSRIGDNWSGVTTELSLNF